MTIGIGVLCSSYSGPRTERDQERPDVLIMISDTMGSNDTDSTDELHKMLVDHERHLFAVCAGRMEPAADLWPLIQDEIDKRENRTYGQMLDAINVAVSGHRAQHFKYDVLNSKYSFGGDQTFLDSSTLSQEWAQYDHGTQMIVGAFDEQGRAYTFFIGHPGPSGGAWVQTLSVPGHVTIGSGSQNASFWLNYRRQSVKMSPGRSLYHSYEASKMASKSPTVNDDIEIVVATYASTQFID